MKKIFLLLCAFTSLMSCSEEKSDRTEMNLNGKVKSVWEKQYDANDTDGIATKGKLMTSVQWNFDKQGNIIEVLWFNIDGDTIQKVVSEFENGKMVKKSMYQDFGQLDMTSTYRYDSKGREIEVLYYDSSDYLVQKEEREYNDDNLIETTLLYDKEGKIIERKVCQKDKKGLPKELKIYNENRELVNFRKEVYDANNRLSEFFVYAADEETLVLHCVMKYDRGGNVISSEASGENGEAYMPEVRKYKFDQKNNWTTMAHYIGDEIKDLTEREIKYY